MTIFYFILAITILVGVHEYGHFWVARKVGVKVLRFSIGFGKPLWSWRDRYGTEFSIAPIPLGGYVKMVDEREGEVAKEDLPYAFTQKTPLERIAIAVAGPMANFLFAVVVYWGLFVSGTTGIIPVVDRVAEDSVAASAGVLSGDQIIRIDGEKTSSWQDVSQRLMDRLGDTGELALSVERGTTAYDLKASIDQFLLDQQTPDPLRGFGVEGRKIALVPMIGQLVANGPAEQSGLRVGDVITSINGEPIDDWRQWVEAVRHAPNVTLQVGVMRESERRVLALTPAQKTLADGQFIGFVGAGVSIPEGGIKIPDDWRSTVQLGPVAAVGEALNKLWRTTQFTLVSMWKMLIGEVSIKNLSGPISIAKVAGASASGGYESFLSFLALLSVSLGVLNLLPIPMLDGGHVVYYGIELLFGRPLSQRTQEWGLKLGVVLLMCLMFVAFYNDLMRP